MKQSMKNKRDLLILDGDCGLCHRLVFFMDNRLSTLSNIGYRPRNSQDAKNILKDLPIEVQGIDTVYLIRKRKYYIRSAAAIRCLLYLNWYWKIWFPILWVIPKPLRDFFYNLIAKYRHKFFDQPNSCTVRID